MLKKTSGFVTCVACLQLTAAAALSPDLVLADFEGSNYGEWTVTGTAFGSAPARGTLPNQMKVSGYQGQGLVNSYVGGDAAQGTLTSPEFTINRRHMSFLIGGGGWKDTTCVNLLVGDRVVRSATGPNTQPGGSEELIPISWDLAEFAGKKARIQVVDQATGGWGHINLDYIVLTDAPTKGWVLDASREFKATKRYLNLPVRNGAPQRRVTVQESGRTVREFEIQLAEKDPDFWVFLDLQSFQGQRLKVTVDRVPGSAAALGFLELGDRIKGAENLYDEDLRPQAHFSARRGWLNDPNGLVYHAGEWHLYFQHNPYGWDWGNMHWGHAVSKDLVHWKELPIALYPKAFGDWAFSGSAVVDWKNTAGFQKGKEPAIVGAYTSTGRGECIIYSVDRGRTFQEYQGNPVVRHEGRDPRLLWHEPTSRWIMALYNEDKSLPEKRDQQGITFYSSPNLKDWTFESRIGGFYECPDLFELPVDGDVTRRKWILTGASSDYLVGHFDGKKFTPESSMLPGHQGIGYYAAQTFSETPAGDQRCIQIGWGRMPSPGMPFNQMMAFPCELSLRTTPEGIRLCFLPVAEISRLYSRTHSWKKLGLDPGKNPLKDVKAGPVHVVAEFSPGSAREWLLELQGRQVRYDFEKAEISCGGVKHSLSPSLRTVRLQIISDRTSLEIYGNDGLLFMPIPTLARSEDGIGLESIGGRTWFESLQVHELKSLWR